MADQKKLYWQDVVYEQSGVTPGTYDRPSFTVNQYGFITDVSGSSTPIVITIPTILDLPGIPSPTTGDQALVLDDGSGGQDLYVYNALNSDLGPPLGKWRLLASTALGTPPTNYINEVVALDASTNLGAPTSLDAKLKRIDVSITFPYTPGTTMSIKEQSGLTWMPSTSINPELVGTYSLEIPENDFKISNTGQMQAVIGGAPVVGASLVYISYIVQS